MTSPFLAYSYIRFSTKEQRKGTSIERQTALRDAFVARMGLRLDTSLRLVDDGVSAHRGKHRSDKYALGQFLKLVEAGRIPRGSFLICESLDRLSREEVDDALRLLLSLTGAGIKVVQLQPAEVVYEKPVEPMKLMMGIMELQRGHSESRMKSERSAGTWAVKRARARENGKPISNWCPGWLRKDGDRFVPIPARVAAVRRMFELSASGFGINGIIRRLVEEGHEPFKRARGKGLHWSNSYIGKILAGRSVLGEYQPGKDDGPEGDPIPGYYPAIVPEDLYYKARAGLRQRLNHKGGRATNGINLFQGILRHALDGDRIELKTFRDNRGGKPRRFPRYVNARSLVAQAEGVSFPVGPFEEAVLTCLAEINPADVLPSHDTAADEVMSLSAQLEETDAKLRDIEDRIVRGEQVGVLVNAARRLEASRAEAAAKLADAKQRAVSPKAEAWGTCRSLIATLAGCEDQEAARLRLRQAIRRIVSEIWCVFVKQGENRLAAVQMWFADGMHRDYLIHSAPPRRTGKTVRPARMAVRSFAAPAGIKGELDLRDPKQAAALEKVLGKIDPAAMG